MSRPLNRMEPKLPADAMKTYGILAPVSTHFRPATCAEIDCPNYLNGWTTTVDERTELGQKQAHYITKQSGRRFTVHHFASGLTEFTFEAGQKCFKAGDHQTRLERSEIFVVRDGDHRGNPRGTQTRKHASAADWQEDFAEHQQTLADRLNEG